ncbi:MAG: hypothetical protein R3B55_02105 [Candidatus Paceibacterota bacterium]
MNFISTSASGTSFNPSANLSPNTPYYFVFKIVPSGDITGDVEVVPVNTPNNGNS